MNPISSPPIDSLTLYGSIGIIFLTTVGVFILLLKAKSAHIKELTNSLNKLMRSFNELDEQAKIIVKTDLELNKTQEELDKRLGDLNTLQKASPLDQHHTGQR